MIHIEVSSSIVQKNSITDFFILDNARRPTGIQERGLLQATKRKKNPSINPGNTRHIEVHNLRLVRTPIRMFCLQPRLHTAVNPHPLRLLFRNVPPIPPIQRRLRDPLIVALLEPVLEREILENPPEPSQVELVVYRRQRVLEIQQLFGLLRFTDVDLVVLIHGFGCHLGDCLDEGRLRRGVIEREGRWAG
jgi:hypothetical protein